MMPTVRITHLLTMLHLCMDTMNTVTIDPGIMAITVLDMIVIIEKEDLVTMVVMDIIGKEINVPFEYLTLIENNAKVKQVCYIKN
ncbi:MAG: hypothetical protein NT010_08595 [Proteobacteria bacterium]|nr:hypothetical protein [Pseudomonadota bacterium]